MVSSTEISYSFSYNAKSSKSQSLNQFKGYNGFGTYPPLWTSHLVAMHDDIGNRSIHASMVIHGADFSLTTKFVFKVSDACNY